MNRFEAIRLRQAILQASKSLSDEIASGVPELFPKWENNKVYITNDRVACNKILYTCIQNHTSQSDWTPDITPSLWVKTADPTIEWPEWEQPIGAQDAYMINSKVSHNNVHWISIVDNNVWEPGVYGWEMANN